jgi:anaphase-promoting complex subunit 3
MDIYSTVLWHLQKDVQLSFLAQELVSINDQAPQAWIATGNCFSLQKDHAQALSCFERATQLDPRCAYGYALSGHEALASEDQDSALQFFRSAIRTDPRHYPAWWVHDNLFSTLLPHGFTQHDFFPTMSLPYR